MSARNMIEAHTRVFASLDKFCLERNDPVKNAGAARWTAVSGKVDKERLLFAELKLSLSFADSLKIGRFDLADTSFFCTVGLDLPEEVDFLQEEDFGGGMLTAILDELAPLPVRSTSEIRNVVEVEDKVLTPDYKGHASSLIAMLFPEIRCFSVRNLADEETQRVFFLLCLSAASRGTLWMNSQLRETLTLIAELSPVAIPYRTLCRSIFDTDPSALFMALYRCLEALYAYSHTTKLMGRLSIQEPWSNVAQILEETLSWRPREEQSLGTLLRYAVLDDLRAILVAMGENASDEGDIVNRATKRIYNLRNSLVHYRPFHQSFQAEKVDWNRLCEATALLVLHVYDSAVTA
ncbi:hypothetical protein [Cupriavidus basilensis]